MNILSVIPARGGSKGIPRKNIIPLANKPLVAWTIEASLKSKLINRTTVSSDDDEILTVSRKWGAEAIKRPKQLASDFAASEPVVTHVLEYLKQKENYLPDIVVLLQPTSPLRTAEDIDKALTLLLSDPKNSAVISVCSLEHSPLKTFKIDENGYLKGIINNRYPFMRRQDLPTYYLHNGAIYAIKTKFFLKTGKLITRRTLAFVMSQEKSRQIDIPEDIPVIEKILSI